MKRIFGRTDPDWRGRPGSARPRLSLPAVVDGEPHRSGRFRWPEQRVRRLFVALAGCAGEANEFGVASLGHAALEVGAHPPDRAGVVATCTGGDRRWVSKPKAPCSI
jgi:hypothetical protein